LKNLALKGASEESLQQAVGSFGFADKNTANKARW